ncbi:MAG TPA: MerR family transcriptional regulator [Chromatiales bacterium]|nr:MerR family transcriptional regulator [Chromatiales bacterium]
MNDSSTLSIGRLSRATGVGVETLRYYERRGLLQPEGRTAAGYRRYRPEAVRRLRFIRRAQALGFSLEEIRELLRLSDDPGADAARVKSLTREKIADIQRRIRDLERMKQSLEVLAERCPGHGPTATCPILEALTGEDDA